MGAVGKGTINFSYNTVDGCPINALPDMDITILPAAIYLSLSEDQVLEGGASVTATVCLAEGLVAPSGGFVVNLSQTSSIADGEYSLSGGDITSDKLPATITIPAGKRCASFSISALADNVLEGRQTLTISAGATGFTADTKDLAIMDRTFGDIIVTKVDDASTGY